MSAPSVNSEKTNSGTGLYQFLNKTNDLAIVIDYKLSILYKNPKAALRIPGNKLQTVISMDHKKEFGLLLNKMMVKNLETYLTRLLFADGIWYECQLTNLLDDADVKGIVCVMKEDVNNNHLSDEEPGTEHFYRVITDSLPAIIAYWTADLRCLFANKAYLSFFNKTENEMYNTRIDQVFTREQISKHEHFMEKALQGLSQRFERVVQRQGKEDKIILTEYVPDVEEGHVMGFYTLIYDITDLKIKEQELAIKNERELFNNKVSTVFSKGSNLDEILSLVLEKLVAYGNFLVAEIWLVGADTKFLSLAAHFALTEMGESFYLNNKGFKIQIEGEGFIRNIWKTRSSQHLLNLEQHENFLRKDAARSAGLKSAYGVPLIDNSGTILGVMMIGMDNNKEPDQQFIQLIENISTHLTAEIIRKKLELELAQIFSYAPDVIAIAGIDGFYKKVNPAMIALLGFSESELLSRPFTTFIHPEDLEHTLFAFKGVTEGRAVHYFENRLIKENGAQIWLAWDVTAAAENGLIFCVGKDITEKKYSEQEMITLNNKLAQQNKQLRDISWIQSHEVRAPTARILGIINIIDSDKAQLSNELRELLGFLKSSALELDEVIAKITALSSAKQRN
ncbi:PAS domain S-box protein [Pedobacter gandavensis]|uniref:histidine kinase n=1 Tax=Pedobacter gandavensis TaxID=2679963 RepID=A0ABR6ESX6_9SPHI|nr:PAS domain S-box protein [Pedobacter gandavensis]MBB2147508.1 PAS domain S-box protein [Pedobacter gandavensis]